MRHQIAKKPTPTPTATSSAPASTTSTAAATSNITNPSQPLSPATAPLPTSPDQIPLTPPTPKEDDDKLDERKRKRDVMALFLTKVEALSSGK